MKSSLCVSYLFKKSNIWFILIKRIKSGNTTVSVFTLFQTWTMLKATGTHLKERARQPGLVEGREPPPLRPALEDAPLWSTNNRRGNSTQQTGYSSGSLLVQLCMLTLSSSLTGMRFGTQQRHQLCLLVLGGQDVFNICNRCWQTKWITDGSLRHL